MYPTFLDLEEAERTEELIRENRERLAGIGEVGLDYWKAQRLIIMPQALKISIPGIVSR